MNALRINTEILLKAKNNNKTKTKTKQNKIK